MAPDFMSDGASSRIVLAQYVAHSDPPLKSGQPKIALRRARLSFGQSVLES